MTRTTGTPLDASADLLSELDCAWGWVREIPPADALVRNPPNAVDSEKVWTSLRVFSVSCGFIPVHCCAESDDNGRRTLLVCRHGAAEVLETTRQWMTSIGLALNETKTRVCHARCEPFDFLGYTFGPRYSPRTSGRYNGARPSKKAVASIKDTIRRRLRPGNKAPWPKVASDLNRTVRGWAAYFSYGSVAKTRHDVSLHLSHRVRA